MKGDELRTELWERMPRVGLTDAEVKAVFAPATNTARAAPALKPGFTWKSMPAPAAMTSQPHGAAPAAPRLPGWSVAWSRFRGCYLFVSADGQVARETSPDGHMNPEEEAAAARDAGSGAQA